MEDLIVTNRPVNLDLRTIRMPFVATLSILHRISGILIFLGTPILLWMLSESLSSAEGFQSVVILLDNLFYKLIFLGILAAFGYHIIAGIKHLFMDRGIGETEESAKVTTVLVVVFSLIWFVFLGMQLFVGAQS